MKKYSFDEVYTEHVKEHFNMKEGFFDQGTDVITGPEDDKKPINTKVLYTMMLKYAKANGVSGNRALALVEQILELFYGLVDAGYSMTHKNILDRAVQMLDKRIK